MAGDLRRHDGHVTSVQWAYRAKAPVLGEFVLDTHIRNARVLSLQYSYQTRIRDI